MGLVEHLLDRPLSFAEASGRSSFGEMDVISPLYATIDPSTATQYELVVACILLRANEGELAGYDSDASTWNGVAVFPDITDPSEVFASLDVLESWPGERYDPGDLVSIDVEF